MLLDSKLSRIGFLFMEANTELLGYHHHRRPVRRWACRAGYTDGSGMCAKTSASLRFNPIKVTRTEQCSIVCEAESMRDICYTKDRGLSWFVFHAGLEICSAGVDGQVGDF